MYVCMYIYIYIYIYTHPLTCCSLGEPGQCRSDTSPGRAAINSHSYS